MIKLIELFFSAPSNNYQEIYRDFEATLISGENDPAYSRMKMRDELQNWADSILDKYGMGVMLITCGFYLVYENDTIECNDFSKLVTIIEACQKDDFSVISEAVKQL